MTDLHLISRFDYRRTHGWWVRVQRKRQGEARNITRLFSDARHGGKRKALEAAIAWRDQLERGLPPRQAPGRPPRPPGYGYVRRMSLPRRTGERHEVYLAWLRIEDRRCASTSRSIAIWGEAGAKAECEKWLRWQRRKLAQRLLERELEGT